LQRGEATDATGTTQTFWADPEIFETTEFDFETLRARFQQMAFLNKGLRITLTDERPAHLDTGDEVTGGEDAAADGVAAADGSPASGATTPARTVTYKYDGGLVDYVKHLNAAKKVELVHPDVIDFESEDTEKRISVEIAMQWTTAYSESVHTYANTISTTEGGTHEEGFRAAMTSLVNRDARDARRRNGTHGNPPAPAHPAPPHTHANTIPPTDGGTHEEGFRAAMTPLVNRSARDKGILKDKDDNLTGDDIREGLTAVVSVKLGEPQFEGQTKTK